jgi:hypothetical protein
MGSSNMQRFEKEENAKVLSCFPSTIRGNSEAAAADGWQEIKKEGISLFLMKTFTRQINTLSTPPRLQQRFHM